MPYSHLISANLTGANLSEANLSQSTFYNCSLYNTCLAYSDLRNSDLRGASFGATLIDGTNLQNCIFSTLSCFSLDFYLARCMDGCVYVSSQGSVHRMSQQPIVLKGCLNTHIIVFDQTVKVGMKFFPKTIIPSLMKMVSSFSEPKLINSQPGITKENNQTGGLA